MNVGAPMRRPNGFDEELEERRRGTRDGAQAKKSAGRIAVRPLKATSLREMERLQKSVSQARPKGSAGRRARPRGERFPCSMRYFRIRARRPEPQRMT